MTKMTQSELSAALSGVPLVPYVRCWRASHIDRTSPKRVMWSRITKLFARGEPR